MITSVELSKKAEKDILKLPNHIQRKLRLWINDVERLGLNEVRKYLVIMTNHLKVKEKDSVQLD